MGGPRYAKVWERLAAFVIDVVLIGVVTSPLMLLGHIPVPQQSPESAITLEYFVSSADTRQRVDSILQSIRVFVALGYFWLLTGMWGRTVGKLALGIQVVDRGGGPPGLGRTGLREVLPRYA